MQKIKIVLIGLLLPVINLAVCATETKSNSDFKKWALTPPMGWNSWDCYGPTVREHEVKANADYMAEHLKEYGWEYIVVDIRWFVENTKSGGYNQKDPRYVLDEFGRYLPAVNRFPSAADGTGFKELADYIHQKGLKFGIHMMRGIPKVAVERKLPVKGAGGVTADQIYSTENQCRWLRDNYTIQADKPGAQEYYNSVFELYAGWGVDFIKIDDLSAPIYHKDEIELIRNAIDNCGRPIVLSTSPGPTPVEDAHHVSEHANMWRMVNDVWDSWGHIARLFNVCDDWYDYIKPGTWPDCDMIPLGRLSIRGEVGEDRMTNLTKDEQYTLMTLFTLFRSPLFFGGDLPSMDDFTLSLLTNREVLKMHAESSDVRQLYRKEGKVAITSKNVKSGLTYLALFNLSDSLSQEVEVRFSDLGLNGNVKITDLWRGEEIGTTGEIFARHLSPHASGLYKIETAGPKPFKLAIIQMDVKGGDKQWNVNHAVELIKEAASNGADIALLPECLDLGWTHPSSLDLAEPIPDGMPSRTLMKAAGDNDIYVCAGLTERTDLFHYNTAVLIDNNGKLLVIHRKLNELDIGHPYYAQGDRLNVATTEFGTIGVMICADGTAKDHVLTRSLCYMGADVILSPSAWAVEADHDNDKTPYGATWQNAYIPVAKEFSVYIFSASNVGWMTGGPWEGWKCIGNSLGFAPDGTEVVKGPYGVDAEAILYIDVNPVKRPARGTEWSKVPVKQMDETNRTKR